MAKEPKQINTSFNKGFGPLFEDIKKVRPDLCDNSKIAQEGVRTLWKSLKGLDKNPNQMGSKLSLNNSKGVVSCS